MSKKSGATASKVKTYTTTIDVGPFDRIPILFTFKSDGTGIAKCQQYDDDDEEVTFMWDPSILEEDGTETEDILSQYAQTLFWDEINQQMDDPVLSMNDYGSENLLFESGNQEELERLIRLVLYCFSALWEGSRDEIDISVLSRTDHSTAGLDEYCTFMEDPDIPDAIRSKVNDLLELCLEWIDPYGWSMEYNDGAYGRSSGYDERANALGYTVARPSFHELAEAREELLQIFTQHHLAEKAQAFLPGEGD